MIYLDNAATSFPKPQSVIRAMVQAQMNIGASPGRGGHRMSLKAGEMVFNLRQKLSEKFSCSSERVIFTLNCTSALNMAIKGSVKKGDHVIISSLEHNSVLRPLHYLREKGIISYSVARVVPSDEAATVSNFLSLIRPETSLVVCSAVSNVFGTLLPVEALGKALRDYNITFIVDAAQAAGSHSLNMKSLGCHILCMPGHKGLLGPMGTGVMLLSDTAEVESLVQGGTGSLSLSESQPDIYPDKLESGTVNFPGLAGLSAGIDFLRHFGGEKAASEKQRELTKILREDLSLIKGIRVYDDISAEASLVTALNVLDYHSEETAELLDRCLIAARAGYHCSFLAHESYGTRDKGVVRLSPGIFNTKKDIKNSVFCLNKIAKKIIL